jgi:hypothetical protein
MLTQHWVLVTDGRRVPVVIIRRFIRLWHRIYLPVFVPVEIGHCQRQAVFIPEELMLRYVMRLFVLFLKQLAPVIRQLFRQPQPVWSATITEHTAEHQFMEFGGRSELLPQAKPIPFRKIIKTKILFVLIFPFILIVSTLKILGTKRT